MFPTDLDHDAPNLVPLDADHPGFRDACYRDRRDAIARLAIEHAPGSPPPVVDYTAAEHGVWRTVLGSLAPLHRELVAERARRCLALPIFGAGSIPQLATLTRELRGATGFAMEPVAGLVTARDFLTALADRRFLSTQYVRHPSAPLYTPEPDVIHEIIGHATTLHDPELAALHVAFGEAAVGASPDRLRAIERVYWFTAEFGLVRTSAGPKALGAGLLSSIGELRQCTRGPELLPFDLERMARTPYDPTGMQPRLFVAPSVDRFLADTRRWLRAGA